jgi:DNA-binding SARP family transcriptional activator
MPSATIEFLVLGPLELRVDGQAIPLGGAKQRAVLALLLLYPNEVVPVERIVDSVWGETPPASAAHAVEANVSRLRGQMGPHGLSIVRQGAGYRLDLDGARLDAQAARELLRSAEEASIAGDGEDAAALSREALQLWRGAALRDAPLHGAARAEAEELDELRLRLLERLADAKLTLGRHEDAAALLRPLVDEHPYRERFVAQLMLALYRSGRPAEALDVYERCRQALDRDLGLRPSADLQRLSGEIVRQDPRLAPPAQQDAAGLPDQGGAAPRRSRLTPRLALAAAALVVAVAGAAVAALIFTRGDEAPPAVLPTSLVRIDPQTLETTQVVRIDPRADLVVVAGAYVWITHGVLRYAGDYVLRNAGDRTLTRVDPETSDARTVGGGLAPCGVTADPSGDVWVANCYESGPSANVVRVDGKTLDFEKTLPVPAGTGFFRGLAYGGGSLWVADTSGGSGDEQRRNVTQVDPRTGPRRTIRFDRHPTVLTWSGNYGDLWMDDFPRGSVSRLHADTGDLKTYESVAVNPGALVVQGDTVWVGDWDIPDVVRIPAVGSGAPRHVPLPVHTRPAGVTSVAAGDGYIWATVPDDHSVWRINPRTNHARRIPLRYFPWGVAVGDDGIWVAVRGRDAPAAT